MSPGLPPFIVDQVIQQYQNNKSMFLYIDTVLLSLMVCG